MFGLLMGLLAGCCCVRAEAGTDGQSGQSRAIYVKFRAGMEKNGREHARLDKVSLSELPWANAGKQDDACFSMLAPYAGPLALKANASMDGVYVLYVRPEGDVPAVIEALRRNAAVERVEAAPVFHLCSGSGADASLLPEKAASSNGIKAPDDPYYGMETGLNLKWHLDLINAEGAWALQTGSPAVTVAVVDNAIWGEHEDLQIPGNRQYHCGTGEPTSSPLHMGAGLDQDEICEQDVLDQYACESYNWSHGTHVAGLLAAVSGNGVGVASLGSGVDLLAVAAPSIQSYGLPGNPYEGMRWAANQGAKVINCSWSAYSSTATEKELIAALVDEGVIIVAGAGNSATYDEYNYPAALPGVISVGACNYDKTRARLSNYGGWVDVMAPGGQGPNSVEKVFSTTFCRSQVLPNAGYVQFEGEYYDYMEGSSMATPLVSALCALILSKDSTVTPREMEELLVSTAQKGQDLGISEASGIIDAEAALKAVDSRVKRTEPDFIASFSGVCESGIAKVYWTVDPQASSRPDFLRLYRNGVLLVDNLPFEDGNIRDTASMLMNHKYEICGVSQGVESYRKEVFVSIGAYYRLQATADPAEGGNIYGTGRYEPRSNARLIAEPNPGYRFVRWSYYDQWTGEAYENPVLSLSMEQEYLGIVAHFEKETGLETPALVSGLRLGPNPVGEVLHVQWPEAFTAEKIQVISLTGACVRKDMPASSSVNVADLAPGLYLLQAFSREGTVASGKFVKR